MSRIFLDVGAHEGQTLEEVIDPVYGFSRILAFEPMPRQFSVLKSREWPATVELLNFGLSDHDGVATLYGQNDGMEASIYPTKKDVDASVKTDVSLRRASTFVDELPDGTIVMKLNCEGAEVPILLDLISTGMIWKLAEIMIDFDIRKVEGFEGEERTIRSKLSEIGFDRFSLCEEVMVGPTHQERIRNWLLGIDV